MKITSRNITKSLALLALATLNFLLSTAHAQGTAFTYQGRLNSSGSPLSGLYDFRFKLLADPLGNTQVGVNYFSTNIPVAGGLFVTTIDFGAGVFNGSNYWLEVDVRTNNPANTLQYTQLTPFQALTPTPYAVFANTASNVSGTVSAAQISGPVALAQLPAVLLTNNDSGVALNGAFTGNAGGLTNLNLTGVTTYSGQANSAVGFDSLYRSTGNFNTADGYEALFSDTIGGSDVAVGYQALYNNTTGSNNLALGASAGINLVNTSSNIDIGNPGVATDNNIIRIGSSQTNTFIAGVLNANGAGLTNLNASNLASGTIPLTQLPAAVLTNGASGVNITGTFTGNGSGVSNVSYSTLAGTGDLATGSWGNFLLHSSATLSTMPTCVIAADVNGDGHVDLITANANANTLTIFTNNGLGGFGSNATLNTSAFSSTINASYNPNCVIAADVNGDGKVDLIVNTIANGLDSLLAVFTNNGAGVFGYNAQSSIGVSSSSVSSIVAADVNHDGQMDLIYTLYANNSLVVYTNNGAGLFAGDFSYPVGGGPVDVIAADVNGDGKADLITANGGAGTLTVLTNNGSGVFGSNATLNVNNNGTSYVIPADVNGDGKVDLINVYATDETLTILTNNGSGVFGYDTNVALSDYPNSVIAADMNGDGKVDLVYGGNIFSSSVFILTNAGNGLFGLNTTLSMSSIKNLPLAADVNGDGHLDLVNLNQNSDLLSVFLNTAIYGGNFSGNFSGNGGGLTSLNGAQVTSIGSLRGSVFIGTAGNSTASGFDNTAYGFQSLPGVTSGGDNTAYGWQALYLNTSGYENTAIGSTALENNGIGAYNTAVGGAALSGLSLGSSNNIALGYSAGSAISSGGNNIDIGNPGVSSDNNIIRLGSSQTATYIAGVVNGNGAGLTSLNAGQLSGTVPTSVLLGFQSPYNTTGGGFLNTNTTANGYNTIAGGTQNTASYSYSSVGGGQNNTANGEWSTIGGGQNNIAINFRDTVGGGLNNAATGGESTIGGGEFNAASYLNCTVAGGESNSAVFYNDTVGGGFYNLATNTAATVSGGMNNIASGNFAAVPGGTNNLAAGDFSFAAGYSARATNAGAFVWSDNSSTTPFTSTNNNSFNSRAAGGYRLFTSSTGSGGAGVFLAANGNSWVSVSDRNAKKNFQPVDYQAVLAKLAHVPVQQWNYQWEKDGDVPNIGPMAQDFIHAFYPGRDDKGISTLEFDGVELAAIQGLNQKLEQTQQAAEAKDAEIQNLEKKLDDLQALVQQLAARK